MNANRRNALVAVTLLALIPPAPADVIVNWNEWTIDFIFSHHLPPPPAERLLAMTHAAMFDAVNSIERKYRPYLVQLPAASTASKEAAAAAAAGTVLSAADPQGQAKTQ